MKGVILAAGLGTRLWPLTIDRAKPAVPFLNRPVIAYCLDYLYKSGVRDFIINLHHCSASVRTALASGLPEDVDIYYSQEEEILGTGGALDRVRDRLLGERFVVVNGKIITEVDLTRTLSVHLESKALATLVLRPNKAYERYSVVEVDTGHRVRRFAGFPTVPDDPCGDSAREPPLMFTGIQILEPEIFDYIPRDVFSHTTTSAYPSAISAGRTVAAQVSEDAWFEISTLERYLDTSLYFLARSGRDLLAGPGCCIDPTAQISRSILWDNVRVGARAALTRCIVGDGCEIPPESNFDQVVIVRAHGQPADPRGWIAGENLVVPIGGEVRT